MFQWLSSNLPTILVALVILTVCALIVIKMIRDKKQGKSSCSCGCSGCAMSNMCHAQNAPRPKQADEAQTELKQ